MSLPDDLIQHALELVSEPVEASDRYLGAVYLRRAVSASYYAIFHLSCQAAVKQIASDLSSMATNRLYRLLNHADLKRICLESSKHSKSLTDLLDLHVSADMDRMALAFIRLQEARHAADYNPKYKVDRKKAMELTTSAIVAIEAWRRIENTAEAKLFNLFAVLQKNWHTMRG